MKPQKKHRILLPLITLCLACAQDASALTFTYSGAQNAMNQGQAPTATYDTVNWNITSGYFGTSGARSQTYNNTNLIFTNVSMNNGWGEAVTTFSNLTTVTGAGNFSLITAGLAQDFVFAGNMTGYTGNISMADFGNATLTLGNTGSNIVQFGGTTAGGTVAQGTTTTDGSGTYINNVSGSGSFSGNNLIFNYASSVGYDYLRVSNSSIAVRDSIAFTGSANLNVVNGISGVGALAKSGAGTVTLSGANSYTGGSSITAGTLALSGSGALGTGNVAISSSAVLNVSGATSGSYTMGSARSLSGAGSVVGELIMGSGSILSPTAGSTLTIGDLTFGSASGDTSVVNIGSLGSYTSNAAISVTSNLVLNGDPGAVTFNLGTGVISSGSYKLIGYGSSTITDASGFTLGTGPTLSSRQSGALTLNTGSVDYVVTGVNPYWTGLVSGEWSTGTLAEPKNWATSPTATTDYIAGDFVLFDDNATGATSVDLSAADVSPTAVEFNNSSLNYGVTGTAAIAGTSTLVKNGTGTVTLGTTNTYTGNTTVNAGTLDLTSGKLYSGAYNNTAAVTVNGGTLKVASFAYDGSLGQLADYAARRVINGGTLEVTGATHTSSNDFQVGASGGTFRYSATGETLSLIGNANDNIQVNGALVFDTIGNITVGEVMAGSGSLTKTGSGVLSLNSANTYSGGTSILDGTLVLGNAQGIGSSGSWARGFTLRNGTFDINGQFNYSTANLGTTGKSWLINSQAIVLGGQSGGVMEVQDSGGLGTGFTLFGLQNAITYDATSNPGTATISAAWLGTGQSGSAIKTINVGDSSATAVELDFTGQLSQNTGNDGANTTIQKTGAGTLRISAANNFPYLQVSEGTLMVNHTNALGTTRTQNGTANNLVTVDGTGTLDLNGFSNSIGGLSGGGVTTGTITNSNTNASILTVGSSNASTTYSGIISDGAGTVGITKEGTGTLTLDGTTTYSGATTVNAGSLVISGNVSTSSLTTVNSGTTIGGSGTVGALIVAVGGAINPGNSPGILNSGDLDMAGTYNAELAGTTAGTGYDQINVTGTVTLSGLLTLTASFTPTEGDLFFILSNDGVDSVSGTFFGLAEGSTVTDNLSNEYKITYSADYGTTSFTGGNDVALMAIPEPGAALLGGIGMLLLLRRRRSA